MKHVAIRTGGGTGLGFAIAERLGKDGHRLVLASREASFVTGDVLCVDGACWLAHPARRHEREVDRG